MKKIRALLLYAQSDENKTLSYQMGWPQHFQSDPHFDCIPVNLAKNAIVSQPRALLLSLWRQCDAIIILHSVFSNGCYLKGWFFEAIKSSPLPKAYFIGNEYKLMPQKMEFCEEIGVSLFVSQSNSPAVLGLYKERLGCKVVCVPSCGLDCNLFVPRIPFEERTIDIGYRVVDGDLYLGHTERREIGEYFLMYGPGYGLKIDISMNPVDRFHREDWANFLNQCKGQLGVEAGSDYFELTDETRIKVNAYITKHPGATLADVREQFFKDYLNPIPLRVISGRQVEAAGTKTVQIMFKGYYNDYFQPDEHYISLNKDFSNFDDVITKYRYASYCQHITENAYQIVRSELTYEKLINKFYHLLMPLL